MTHSPENGGIDPFLTDQMMPYDQLQSEMQLVEKYEQKPMKAVVSRNLGILKRFAGISIPQFGDMLPISKNIDEDNMSSEMTEDLGGGLVSFGSTHGPRDWVFISLMPQQKELSIDEFNNLAEQEKNEYRTTTQYGESTIGTHYPAEAKQMLQDMFTLTGAKIVRDDSHNASGSVTGVRFRKGHYMDTPIYFEEIWNSFKTTSMGVDTHRYMRRSVRILGNDIGETAALELSIDDFKRIEEQTGLTGFEIRSSGVNKATMEAYIGSIAEINGIPTTSEFDTTTNLGSAVMNEVIDAVKEVVDDVGGVPKTPTEKTKKKRPKGKFFKKNKEQ